MRTHPVLERLARFGQRLGLTRLESFLAWIGDPHKSLRCIHVAGSNGKGSVVRMVGRILQEDGRRVGEYTSPHLQHVNERIRIDGEWVSDTELSDVLVWLQKEAEAWAEESVGGEFRADRVLTYFEMMTAAAFVIFERASLDIVVFEVGLGGRLDATNLITPMVTAITTIDLEHTDRLGETLEEVASEKAGIIKSGRPVIVGSMPESPAKVISAIALDRGAPIRLHGRDFRIASRKDGTLHWKGRADLAENLKVGLPGAHQIENAAVAIAVVLELPKPPSVVAIFDGLASASHAGRIEWLGPDLLVDCAHNGGGAQRLAEHVRGLPRGDRKRILLIGMSEDKDPRTLVYPLAPLFDLIYTTRCAHPRASSADSIAEQLSGLDISVAAMGPIEEALPRAMEMGGMVVATGSVFLVGAVRDIIGAK